MAPDPEIEAAAKKWDVHFGGGDFIKHVESTFTEIEHVLVENQKRLAEIEYRIQQQNLAYDPRVEKSPPMGYLDVAMEAAKDVEPQRTLWQKIKTFTRR